MTLNWSNLNNLTLDIHDWLFQILIQKEWLQIGHPFSKRNQAFLYGDKENEGPVFIQWLDCVYQVTL